MACFTPLLAWRYVYPDGTPVPTDKGGSMHFEGSLSYFSDDEIRDRLNPKVKRSNSYLGFDIKYHRLPCGKCIGCRLERSRQWAMRCVHEASLYEDNCFITLTFNDEFLDPSGSLVKRDFQLFMKRLRKRFSPRIIRFFHCGEYGEQLSRPHHHALLFNFDFPDKKFWTARGHVRLYTSEILSELWPYGFSTIGDANFESAAYVARYVTKKVNGEMAKNHYGSRIPEYLTMSRRPGIGHGWFEKFKDDIYPSDFFVLRNNVKCKPPKYYDNLYDLTNPDEMAMIKDERGKRTSLTLDDNLPRRLKDRMAVQTVRYRKLLRGYENDKSS